MVASALPFEQRHPAYVPNRWNKKRQPDIWQKFLNLLPKMSQLSTQRQHEKIMDGSLLRGVKKPVARPLPLPSHELSKRQVKILRRLKAGDEINVFGARAQLVQGSRRCNIRFEDVRSLQVRGLVTSAFAVTDYGLNALTRVV